MIKMWQRMDSEKLHLSQGRAHVSAYAGGMKAVWLLVAAISAVGLFGLGLTACTPSEDGPEIPAQPYINALTAMGTPTGELTGQILFSSEYAQHSIRFSLDHVTFVTHPDGRFHIARIPAGQHLLKARIKGYEPVSLPVAVPAGGRLVLEPLALVQARGLVLGRLVREKGLSAKGLKVRLDPNDGVEITDSEGIFQFLGVSAGEHVLRVRDHRYFAGNTRFRLKANERRNLGNIRVYLQTRLGTHTDRRTARLQN